VVVVAGRVLESRAGRVNWVVKAKARVEVREVERRRENFICESC